MLRCKQVDRAGRSGSHSRSFQLKCLGEKLNGSLDALRNAVDLKGFEFLGIAEGTATSIAVPETDTEHRKRVGQFQEYNTHMHFTLPTRTHRRMPARICKTKRATAHCRRQCGWPGAVMWRHPLHYYYYRRRPISTGKKAAATATLRQTSWMPPRSRPPPCARPAAPRTAGQPAPYCPPPREEGDGCAGHRVRLRLQESPERRRSLAPAAAKAVRCRRSSGYCSRGRPGARRPAPPPP